MKGFMENDADDFEMLYRRVLPVERMFTHTSFAWQNQSFMSQITLPDGTVESFPTTVYKVVGDAGSQREAVERWVDHLNKNMTHFPGGTEDFADIYRPYSQTPYTPEPGYLILVGEAGSPSSTGATTSAFRLLGLKAEQFYSPNEGARTGSVEINGTVFFYEGNSLGLATYTKNMPACALIRTTIEQIENFEFDTSCGQSTRTSEPAQATAGVKPVSDSPDRAALVALYNATDGLNWANNTNWLGDRPIGEWFGVTTFFKGRVTKLRLSGNQLTGEIPPELGNLDYLISLDLNVNRLTGTVAPELGKLTYLTSLSLSWNGLTGEIPPELGNLTNLTSLGLSDNRLTGEMPSELGNLEYLNWLILDRNQLTGCVPALLEDRLSRLMTALPLPFCKP